MIRLYWQKLDIQFMSNVNQVFRPEKNLKLLVYHKITNFYKN